jgi:hypothetical protein
LRERPRATHDLQVIEGILGVGDEGRRGFAQVEHATAAKRDDQLRGELLAERYRSERICHPRLACHAERRQLEARELQLL